MLYSILERISAWWRPEARLRCHRRIWNPIVAELAKRGAGQRESGAFLLGRLRRRYREILDVAYYDDLAPGALNSGAILFPGRAYSNLWRRCRDQHMRVVADIHTHPGAARQSCVDRDHPMIAQPGHIALILPRFAERPIPDHEIGVYEYLGGHAWRDHSGQGAPRIFRIV